jgi:excisionase family DNA binding protein
MANQQLYKISEVTEMLSLSRSSIYREIQEGKLNVVRIGKAIRFLDTEITRYVNSLEAK